MKKAENLKLKQKELVSIEEFIAIEEFTAIEEFIALSFRKEISNPSVDKLQNLLVMPSAIINLEKESLNERNSINIPGFSKLQKKYSMKKKGNAKKLSCSSKTSVDEKLKTDRSKTKNYSIYTVLESENTKLEFLKYMIFRYFFPFSIFTMFILAMLFFHIYVMNDYCYYGNMCRCQNLGIYFYTIIRECLQYYSVGMIMFFFLSKFLTDDFFGKNKIKWTCCLIQFIPVLCIYVYYFPHANETDHAFIRKWVIFSIAIMNLSFVLFLFIIFKKLSKKIIEKTLKVILFTSYFYFHCYYFKTSLCYYILQFMENNFQKNLALNVFKLFLLFYLMIYQILLKHFLFFLYKEIITSKKIQLCLIINLTRFMSIDILSIKIMNVLSIPLQEIFSWISFANYIYSLVSSYSGTNIIGTFFYKIICKVIHKKIQQPSLILTKFNEIRSGCAFEANIIIFLRMIIFKIMPNYFLFTKKNGLFENCTLKIKQDSLLINNENIVLVIISHSFLVAIIFFFMLKTKKAWIHLNSERFWNITRLVIFLGLFSVIDYNIQFYASLVSLNKDNF